MKRLPSFALMLVMMLSASAQFNLGGLLEGLGSKGDNNGVSDAISGIVGGLLSSDKLQLADLTGQWDYSAPAVCFKSENLLKKAGGAAVATTVEEKIAPYYKLTGLDKVSVTINEDSTFVMKIRSVQLKGSIELGDVEDGVNAVFHFKALNRINLGQMNAYIVVNKMSKTVDIMFDVTRLLDIAEKVSSVAKSKTVSSVVSLLKSYDGLCAGFTMNRQK